MLNKFLFLENKYRFVPNSEQNMHFKGSFLYGNEVFTKLGELFFRILSQCVLALIKMNKKREYERKCSHCEILTEFEPLRYAHAFFATLAELFHISNEIVTCFVPR